MSHGYIVNWAARIEFEAKERARVSQEQQFDDIRRDEHENVLERLRKAAPEWQSKLTLPKRSVRWQMLRLRSVLAKLL